MRSDWRDGLEAGDVIVSASGTPRVVRAVHYTRLGFLRSVSLVILRCSWTTRCYTIVNRADLLFRGFSLGGVRVPLDPVIGQSIGQLGPLSCCDVKGVL